jgi:hypothetical protein
MLKLHTDDFSNALDRNFRNELIENFKWLEDYCNNPGYLTDYAKKNDLSNLATKQDITDLKAMIQRITLGTDEPTIEAKVEAALKERGF